MNSSTPADKISSLETRATLYHSFLLFHFLLRPCQPEPKVVNLSSYLGVGHTRQRWIIFWFSN